MVVPGLNPTWSLHAFHCLHLCHIHVTEHGHVTGYDSWVTFLRPSMNPRILSAVRLCLFSKHSRGVSRGFFGGSIVVRQCSFGSPRWCVVGLPWEEKVHEKLCVCKECCGVWIEGWSEALGEDCVGLENFGFCYLWCKIVRVLSSTKIGLAIFCFMLFSN